MVKCALLTKQREIISVIVLKECYKTQHDCSRQLPSNWFGGISSILLPLDIAHPSNGAELKWSEHSMRAYLPPVPPSYCRYESAKFEMWGVGKRSPLSRDRRV